MQLDIYADDQLIRTISEDVKKFTRNEVRYTTTIPAGTDSVSIVSVGGATTKRACMQELYLLTPKSDIETILSSASAAQPTAKKVFINGTLYIIVGNRPYSVLGL